MLRVENLQISRGRKTVLADVTLDLLPGEVLGVLRAQWRRQKHVAGGVVR